jgi:phage-related protein
MGMGIPQNDLRQEDTGSINDSMIPWANKSLGYNFLKNDIVKYKNAFWYCLKDHFKTSETEPGTDSANTYWGGVIILSNISSITKIGFFIWTPSYTSTIQHKPTVTTIRFGNGYEQRVSKSINPDLKTLQLNFDQRTSREARAIIHFLKQRSGTQSFAYNPGDIYSENTYRTKYVCREWETSFTFKENYSVRAKFEEVSA